MAVKLSTVVVIKANASAFIVPNIASTVRNWSLSEEKAKRMDKLCKLNGRQFDRENDKLVDLWIHSEDLHSNNLTDHGGYFFNNNDRVTIYVSEHFIPHSMLLGHKEGDVIDIVLPGMVVRKLPDTDDVEDVEAMIALTVTLKQKGYRYGSFGVFEEALNAIL